MSRRSLFSSYSAKSFSRRLNPLSNRLCWIWAPVHTLQGFSLLGNEHLEHAAHFIVQSCVGLKLKSDFVAAALTRNTGAAERPLYDTEQGGIITMVAANPEVVALGGGTSILRIPSARDEGKAAEPQCCSYSPVKISRCFCSPSSPRTTKPLSIQKGGQPRSPQRKLGAGPPATGGARACAVCLLDKRPQAYKKNLGAPHFGPIVHNEGEFHTR